MATERFIVRPFQSGDAAGARAVLAASYGAEATPAPTYDWWSFGFADAISGFKVAETDGRIVGVQPMEIFPFTDGSISLKGALLTGVAVHPDFRRRGIFSALMKACENEAWQWGAVFVTTMPNEKSRPGFLRTGYADLGCRQLLVRPLRPVVLGGKVLPVLGHLAGAVGGVFQSVAKRIPAAAGITVRKTSVIIPEVESLAERHAEIFPGLRMRRSADWLRWRFLESSLRKYHLLEARDAAGKLAGFAAATVDGREKSKVCYLMDLFISETRHAAAMLGALCEWARTENADAVATVVSSAALAETLCHGGFSSVPTWLPLKKFYSVAKFNPHQPAPADWRTLAGWYQTLADWDNL
jgi:GNAT superfamily N-acetyltransferase